MKTCKDCGETKPLDDFNRRNRGKDGRQSYCRPCHKARRDTWESSSVEARRLNHRRDRLKREYGLTAEDYEALLAAQGGVCAICGGLPTYGASDLDVDHDHTTGEVRGLLCRPCNLGVGKFKDDPALLARAIDYLNRKETHP